MFHDAAEVNQSGDALLQGQIYCPWVTLNVQNVKPQGCTSYPWMNTDSTLLLLSDKNKIVEFIF